MNSLDKAHITSCENCYETLSRITNRISNLPTIDEYLENWNIKHDSQYRDELENIIEVLKKYKTTLEITYDNLKSLCISSNDHSRFSQNSLEFLDRDFQIAELNFQCLIDKVDSLFTELCSTSEIALLNDNIDILFNKISQQDEKIKKLTKANAKK